MSFLIAAFLFVAAAVFFLAGHGQVFPAACQVSGDLCRNSQWLTFAALGFVLVGLVFRIGN